jgi:Ca2+-dependent lipid-binding protein
VCIDCGYIERSDDGIIPVTVREVEALHNERQSVSVREAAYAVV